MNSRILPGTCVQYHTIFQQSYRGVSEARGTPQQTPFPVEPEIFRFGALNTARQIEKHRLGGQSRTGAWTYNFKTPADLIQRFRLPRHLPG